MASFDIDPDMIRQLAALLKEGDLTELEIEQGDYKIRVARQPAPVTVTAGGSVAPVTALAQAMPPPAGGGGDHGHHPGAVQSPMVGTANLAPEPGAATFVSVGDFVREGQTLLILEAMKVMNPIPAPKAGRVARVLVKNGAPVEYGEPLMIIE